MRNFLSLLLCLCLTSWAKADEILAWHVSLSHFTSDGLKTPGVVRLESAPEKSPFFDEGDELWDIRAALPDVIAKANASPEWAVWNATSGRIITKGTLTAANALYYHLDIKSLPTQIQSKIELFRVPDGGSQPDFSIEPDASLTLTAQNGTRYNKASLMAKGAAINLECEPMASNDKSVIDFRILVTATLPNCPELEINTATTLSDRSRVWLARDYDGKSGVDIRVSATIQLLNGTPFSEAVIRESGESFIPPIIDWSSEIPLEIDNKWLVSRRLHAASFQEFITGLPSGEDPFAPVNPEKELASDKLPQTPTPAKLAPYFAGPIYDIGEALKRAGINKRDSDFAGYDPATQRIFMYSADKEELDKFDQLFSPSCILGPPASLVITTRGNGQMMLITRSGNRGSLKSNRKELKLTRELEVEPVIGENENLVDLRVLYEEKSGDTLLRALNSSTTLTTGKFSELMTGSFPENTETKMEIKAEVFKTQ